MIEPLHFSFDVACPPDRAFQAWTADIARWWPPDHTVTGETGLHVVLEGRPGGRIYERAQTGAEHDWGQITVWEPPTRLVYLWHLRRDRADATEVEITFTGQEGHTRVQIEHRGWERLGALGPDWRQANFGGWSTLLPHYERFVTVSSQ